LDKYDRIQEIIKGKILANKELINKIYGNRKNLFELDQFEQGRVLAYENFIEELEDILRIF
jgi:hypothetical protein